MLETESVVGRRYNIIASLICIKSVAQQDSTEPRAIININYELGSDRNWYNDSLK